MRLPSDWEAKKAPGWWELYYLIHTLCRFQSKLAYDLICDESTVRNLIYCIHECGEESR